MAKVKIIKERSHYLAPAIHIVLAVDVIGEVELEALKVAICKATKNHELLNTKIVQENSGECYYVTDENTIMNITVVQEYEMDILQKIINEQERIPFDFENGELLRFFVLNGKEHVKLIIVAHHLAGDGMSMLYLIRDIMEQLADKSLKKELQPIQLYDINKMPKEAKLDFRVRLLTKIVNKQWNKNKHIFCYQQYKRMFERYWKNRQTKLFTASLEKEQVPAIINASKKHHITVNSAIMTAILKAAKGEKDIGVAVNVRENNCEGMGNYTTAISVEYTYNENKSFWENAELVHELAYEKLNNNKKKYFLTKFMAALEPTLIDSAYFSAYDEFKNPVAAKIKELFGYGDEAKGINISNLGKTTIPTNYGEYKIDQVVFVPPLVPNVKRMIGVLTLADKMEISMQVLEQEGVKSEKKLFLSALEYLKNEKA